MKKLVTIVVLMLSAAGLKAQEVEARVEEKASNWLVVTAPAVVKKSAVVRKAPVKKPVVKKVQPKPAVKPPEVFDKTNQQVNRFKKGN